MPLNLEHLAQFLFLINRSFVRSLGFFGKRMRQTFNLSPIHFSLSLSLHPSLALPLALLANDVLLLLLLSVFSHDCFCIWISFHPSTTLASYSIKCFSSLGVCDILHTIHWYYVCICTCASPPNMSKSLLYVTKIVDSWKAKYFCIQIAMTQWNRIQCIFFFKNRTNLNRPNLSNKFVSTYTIEIIRWEYLNMKKKMIR